MHTYTNSPYIPLDHSSVPSPCPTQQSFLALPSYLLEQWNKYIIQYPLLQHYTVTFIVWISLLSLNLAQNFSKREKQRLNVHSHWSTLTERSPQNIILANYSNKTNIHLRKTLIEQSLICTYTIYVVYIWISLVNWDMMHIGKHFSLENRMIFSTHCFMMLQITCEYK